MSLQLFAGKLTLGSGPSAFTFGVDKDEMSISQQDKKLLALQNPDYDASYAGGSGSGGSGGSGSGGSGHSGPGPLGFNGSGSSGSSGSSISSGPGSPTNLSGNCKGGGLWYIEVGVLWYNEVGVLWYNEVGVREDSGLARLDVCRVSFVLMEEACD